MGDFYIDFRSIEARRTNAASDFFKFFPDIQVGQVEESTFSLVFTRCDNASNWGPYHSKEKGITVWLIGRVALEDHQWEQARTLCSAGGLSSKAIFEIYANSGFQGLTSLNGNFTVLLYDKNLEKVFIVTDRAGAAPGFQHSSNDSCPVFSSHPDFLAASTGEEENLDLVSLCEFLSTGKVSYPFTYYENLKAIPFGSILEIDLKGAKPRLLRTHSYFTLDYRIDDRLSETDVAARLAQAFQNAVRRRTYPGIGRSIVSLSGGLDSRMILSGCRKDADVQTVSFFDEENQESAIAKAIASAVNVPHIPLQRKFEHYGDSASKGVHISGGMSSFASNHFLGFRDRFRALGAESLLTGCYCDYLFKALALSRTTHPVWRRESIGPFSHNWYRPYFQFRTKIAARLAERLDSIFPETLRRQNSEEALLAIEARRLFPFSYEPDSLQRVIPQRVLPWYVPAADSEVLSVYLQTPPRFKLNASMFSKMVRLVCDSRVCAIPDANTGVAVNASTPMQLLGVYSKAIQNRFYKNVQPRLATPGSWPNWQYYATHSKKLHELWSRETPGASSLFETLLGYDPFERPLDLWIRGELELFLRVLTIKIWMGERYSLSKQELHSDLAER